MDLQPTWDMPYGRSLGEDDKGRTPDLKGPIKRSCTVTRCAKRQEGREVQTTTTVLNGPNYETYSSSLSSSSSSLTSSSTSSSQYFQLLFSASPIPHSKSWLFLLSLSFLFRPTHCFVSIAVRLKAKCSRTEWLKCTILSPY